MHQGTVQGILAPCFCDYPVPRPSLTVRPSPPRGIASNAAKLAFIYAAKLNFRTIDPEGGRFITGRLERKQSSSYECMHTRRPRCRSDVAGSDCNLSRLVTCLASHETIDRCTANERHWPRYRLSIDLCTSLLPSAPAAPKNTFSPLTLTRGVPRFPFFAPRTLLDNAASEIAFQGLIYACQPAVLLQPFRFQGSVSASTILRDFGRIQGTVIKGSKKERCLVMLGLNLRI